MNLYPKLILTLLMSPMTFLFSAPDRLHETVGFLIKIDSDKAQLNAIRGFKDGLKGLLKVEMPSNWHVLEKKYSINAAPQMSDILRELNQKFGNQKANKQALALVLDEEMDVEKRRKALASLLSQKYRPLLEQLKKLLEGPLSQEAIRAYATYDSPEGARYLLATYASFDSNKKKTVIETLASRKSYARELFNSMQKGEVSRAEVPAYVARSMKSLLGKQFIDFYDEDGKQSSNKQELIAKYKRMLSTGKLGSADSSKGRAIYMRTCAACHKMYDTGGVIGPDLTGSNRADLDYILLNIVDPSFDVPDNYKMVTIHTNSGQMLMGNIIEEGAGSVTMKMIGQKKVIAKSEIKSRQVSKVSMMPEGLLNTLKNDELLDLIKYLQTEKQVELP